MTGARRLRVRVLGPGSDRSTLDLLALPSMHELNTASPSPLPCAEVAGRFRRTLDQRGVATETLQFLQFSSAWLHCGPCLHQAAEGLDMQLEWLDPLACDVGVQERYDHCTWSADSTQPDGLTPLAPTPYGLFRLRAPEGDLWLWQFSFRIGARDEDRVCAATPTRAVVRRLLAATRRLHLQHTRDRPELIVLGGCGESRSWSKPVRWDDVLLPDDTREELRRTVSEFFQQGELYLRHGLTHRRGILLAGPPGNGKTTILRAIHTELDVPTVVVGIGDQNRDIYWRRAFRRAAELAPAVICFEDLDALVTGSRLSQFLNQLDGLEATEGLLVVATTNRPEAIDPAIARRPSRFDRVFLIGPPSTDLRARYLQRTLGDEVEQGVCASLAERTEDYSVAFLQELIVQARLLAMRRGDERLLADDLEAALSITREHLRLATAGLEDRGRVGFGLETERLELQPVASRRRPG